MLHIHMLCFLNVCHDCLENIFNVFPQFVVDEVPKCSVAGPFVIHQIHVSDVHFATVFQLPQGCVAAVHKAKQDCFQHVDPTVPWPSRSLIRLRLQILFDSDLLHDLVKCQYRIANIQTICNKHWKSALLWTIICFGIDIVHTIIIPKKGMTPKLFCLRAIFFFRGFFSQPPFLSLGI